MVLVRLLRRLSRDWFAARAAEESAKEAYAYNRAHRWSKAGRALDLREPRSDCVKDLLRLYDKSKRTRPPTLLDSENAHAFVRLLRHASKPKVGGAWPPGLARCRCHERELGSCRCAGHKFGDTELDFLRTNQRTWVRHLINAAEGAASFGDVTWGHVRKQMLALRAFLHQRHDRRTRADALVTAAMEHARQCEEKIALPGAMSTSQRGNVIPLGVLLALLLERLESAVPHTRACSAGTALLCLSTHMVGCMRGINFRGILVFADEAAYLRALEAGVAGPHSPDAYIVDVGLLIVQHSKVSKGKLTAAVTKARKAGDKTPAELVALKRRLEQEAYLSEPYVYAVLGAAARTIVNAHVAAFQQPGNDAAGPPSYLFSAGDDKNKPMSAGCMRDTLTAVWARCKFTVDRHAGIREIRIAVSTQALNSTANADGRFVRAVADGNGHTVERMRRDYHKTGVSDLIRAGDPVFCQRVRLYQHDVAGLDVQNNAQILAIKNALFP